MNIIDRLNDNEMYVDAIDDAITEIESLNKQVAELRETLKDAINQFAPAVQYKGRLVISSGGLSALEDAFSVLGWPDPKPVPERECMWSDDCHANATCGTPTPNGYKHFCNKHFIEFNAT